jgi:hypothetical protein
MGVEISRREVKRSGREVCVKSSRRRRKAATRTRGRRFEWGGGEGGAIEERGEGLTIRLSLTSTWRCTCSEGKEMLITKHPL